MKKLITLLFLAFLAADHLSAQIINASGTTNYTIANYPGNFTGFYDGFSVIFRVSNANAGPATMMVGAFGPAPIVNTAGNALAAGDIAASQVVMMVYDLGNTRFQMISASGNAGGGISGGTIGRLPIFTSATTLGNSSIYEVTTNVGIGASPGGSYKLEVNGLVGSTGINETSDRRYKKNIFTIENALQKVLLLRGVNYDWRTDEFKEKNFVPAPQIGLIAQEVEKIMPQVVTTDASGFKSVEYSKLVALLIEAIKEQQGKIQSLQSTVDSLQNQNSQLKTEREKEMQALKADVKSMHDAVDILLKENVSLKTGQK